MEVPPGFEPGTKRFCRPPPLTRLGARNLGIGRRDRTSRLLVQSQPCCQLHHPDISGDGQRTRTFSWGVKVPRAAITPAHHLRQTTASFAMGNFNYFVNIPRFLQLIREPFIIELIASSFSETRTHIPALRGRDPRPVRR